MFVKHFFLFIFITKSIEAGKLAYTIYAFKDFIDISFVA